MDERIAEALFGHWGVVDTDDVAEAVGYLAESGRVDGKRVGVEGGSAGGYNVLNSLCFYPETFASGICICGVSDVKGLTTDTQQDGVMVRAGSFGRPRQEPRRNKIRFTRREAR